MVDFRAVLRSFGASRMIFEARESFYLGLSPFAVKSMFWFNLLANEIAGNFISSSGYGPD